MRLRLAEQVSQEPALASLVWRVALAEPGEAVVVAAAEADSLLVLDRLLAAGL